MAEHSEDIDPGLLSWLREQADEHAVFVEGMEDAIIGVAEQAGRPTVIVYDAERCIELLMEHEGMSGDDAVQYFTVNVLAVDYGEDSPVFLWRPPAASPTASPAV